MTAAKSVSLDVFKLDSAKDRLAHRLAGFAEIHKFEMEYSMNVAALPKDEALNGTWTRPALKALNESGQWAQEVHAYLRLSVRSNATTSRREMRTEKM